MLEVGVEELQGHTLEGAARGRDLREDVDAVRVLVDHPLQSPHLSLDAPEPAADCIIVRPHDNLPIYPRGVV